jgi:transposase
MMAERRIFTREFKREAVRLSMEAGRSGTGVAKELGIHPNVLYRWRKELLEDSAEAFPGRGKMKASDEEVARLRREVATLREEREILKKALVFFSKESR